MGQQAGEKRKLAKASIGYLIGNYCVKGISLISIPLFARLMSAADYGIYNTFLAYESILSIVMGLALHSSIKNANIRFPGQLDRYISSVLLMPILFFSALFSAVAILHRPIEEASGLPFAALVCLVMFSYTQGLLLLYQTRLAIDYDSARYLKISACNAITNVTVSLILILTVFSKNRAMGRIIGTTVTGMMIGGYVLALLVKKARPYYQKAYWKYALKISLPVIPHGLAQVILLQFDRIMINSMIGSAEAGLYSFSYNIYNMLFIGYNSLDTVYSQWVFNKLQDKNSIPTIKKVATGFAALLAMIIALVALLAPEIIFILGGDKYRQALDTVYPVLLAGFFSMSYGITVVLEYYYEKTNIMALGTCLAALINVVLNGIFIPRYGYTAAAYTTLVSYILYFIFHSVIAYALGRFFILDFKVFVPLTLGLVFVMAFSRYCVHDMLLRMISVAALLAVPSAWIIKKFGMKRLILEIKSLLGQKS